MKRTAKTDAPLAAHLLSVSKIWAKSKCCAFTDLIYFSNQWLCVFRESDAHELGANGTITIIASKDGNQWNPIANLVKSGIDLRDPKLSITPDGRLMLLAGGTVYKDKKYATRQPMVAFSNDGTQWTPLQTILEPHEWLWRVTWHQGKAYGVSYRQSKPGHVRRKWIITLFESSDGLHFQKVVEWPLTHYPNETTLRFLSDGRMVALVRRERGRKSPALIGTSSPPFKRWSWQSSGLYFGGPNFLVFDDDTMIAAGRALLKTPYGYFACTVITHMNLHSLTPVLALPSSGDTSYPGMVFKDGVLWVSYYSSHEGSTAIYLAKVKLRP